MSIEVGVTAWELIEVVKTLCCGYANFNAGSPKITKFIYWELPGARSRFVKRYRSPMCGILPLGIGLRAWL